MAKLKPGMIVTTYAAIRDQIKPGDVFAFSGSGFPSDQIKQVTGSPISHVGVAMQTKLILSGRPQPGVVNMLAECTTLNVDGKSGGLFHYLGSVFAGKQQGGVQLSRLSDRIDNYKGTVFYLPLEYKRRQFADWVEFFNYMLHVEGKPYDRGEIVRLLFSYTPWIGKKLLGHPILHAAGMFICSQLVEAGFVEAKFIDALRSNQNVTPREIVALKIYKPNYFVLKGSPIELPEFNTVDVGATATYTDTDADHQTEEPAPPEIEKATQAALDQEKAQIEAAANPAEVLREALTNAGIEVDHATLDAAAARLEEKVPASFPAPLTNAGFGFFDLDKKVPAE